MTSNYKKVLVKFMNFRDSPAAYTTDTVFTQEQLAAISPPEIKRWFNVIVYNSEDPAEDAIATLRSSTIAFNKKALSSFMPNRLMVYNELAGVGNPTKSTEVNDFIKAMKQKMKFGDKELHPKPCANCNKLN